jgi:hypothetical protein
MTKEFYEEYLICHDCNGTGMVWSATTDDGIRAYSTCQICLGRRRPAIPKTELFSLLLLNLALKFKVRR